MKRYLPIGFMLLSTLTLGGCAYNRYPYLNTDLTKETWQQELDTNANVWTKGADRWFLTGDPNATELADRNAPYDASISTMRVDVPDFTNINVDGAFQVQIFGTYNPNSVYVYGPNEGVRQVVVSVRGNTLNIRQATKKAPTCMKRVIIRIGIRNLNCLTQTGIGSIEGIQVLSNDFKIISSGSGNIYLAGNVNLRRVQQSGSNTISVFGANAPTLDIKTSSTGSVNVSGNVGVKSITHHGFGDINIIGVNSDGLSIYADGKGKIGLYGHANLKEVQARDNMRVYLYQSRSASAYAYAYDHARIGVAGYVDSLYVNTFGSSRFDGRFLRAETAYVRARDSSHINVTAGNKIFASATQNASVYFFGEPKLMSQFVSGNGSVIPIWSDDPRSDPRIKQKYSYREQNEYPRYKWKNGKLQDYKDGGGF